MESGSSSYSDETPHKARHKAKKGHRSLACAILAGSVVEAVIATIYCFVAFVIFWQVLDDPVNFPDLFPLRIDTAMIMLFQIALLYGVTQLIFVRYHFQRFGRAVLFLHRKGASVNLRAVLDGHPVQVSGGKAETGQLVEIEFSGSVLKHCRQDYLLSIASWSLAALLPWNLWGYTRVTLFGGLAPFILITWPLFALAAYARLHSIPNKHNSPVWDSLIDSVSGM
jgi:hypothetical protein